MNTLRPFTFKTARDDGFTLIELLVVIATVAVLAVMLLPALAATHPDSQAFQCVENQRQLILGWRMYAEDNNDLLPPNDYPYMTTYRNAANKTALKNWVVGTMASASDNYTINGVCPEFTDPNTLLSRYVTNALVYHCPADNYIDVFAGNRVHVRSVSMNSAVGTIWNTSSTYGNTAPPPGIIGQAVGGGWLNGSSYNGNQTTWLTYGKMSSFTRPGPANTFVIMDENPTSINDPSIVISAYAAPGNTFLIDFPAGNHNGAAGISFADGHVIIHKWQDPRTYTLTTLLHGQQGTGRQTPDDPDMFYLAPITSAPR